ncbi:hypothetical protein KFE25_010747 [Diacronema lutheri]|uniref:TOG domain-containing protein n=1 Tax=Diacronema lutheri TaxID=2081491 RepID=A0A8J5X8Y1_DIALT|nr:hypothetical protein KFE25_010747 [Diacronema lutheri]
MKWGICSSRGAVVEPVPRATRPTSAPIKALPSPDVADAARVQPAARVHSAPHAPTRGAARGASAMVDAPGAARAAEVQACTRADLASPLDLARTAASPAPAPSAGAPPGVTVVAFGEALASKVASPFWQTRVEGLELFAQRVRGQPPTANAADAVDAGGVEDARGTSGAPLAAAALAACIEVLAPALADKLVPVYLAGLAGVRAVFLDAPLTVPLAELRDGLARLLPQLVVRAASQTHAAVRAETTALLRELARSSRVGAPVVLPALLAPVRGRSDRGIGGRLELVSGALDEFGLGDESGLRLDAVFRWAAPFADQGRSELLGHAKDGRSARGLALALLHRLYEADPAGTLALAARESVGGSDLVRRLQRDDDDVLREASVLTGLVGSRLAESRVLPPKAHRRAPTATFPDFELVTRSAKAGGLSATQLPQRPTLTPLDRTSHGSCAYGGALAHSAGRASSGTGADEPLLASPLVFEAAVAGGLGRAKPLSASARYASSRMSPWSCDDAPEPVLGF